MRVGARSRWGTGGDDEKKGPEVTPGKGEAGFPTSPLRNQCDVERGGWGRVKKLRQGVWLSVTPAQNPAGQVKWS